MKKEYDFTAGVRGKFHRPTKIQNTIRLDADVIKFFQDEATTQHIGYQTLINNKLRDVMEHPSGTVDLKHLRKELEKVVKTVIKKELKTA